jgi:hypothetical protein
VRKPTNVGYRGRALLILGFLDLTVSTSLAVIALENRTVTGATGFIARTLPAEVLATGWAVVAFLCFVFAFRRHDAFAWASAIGIKVFWGLLSVVGWMTGEIPNGYLAAGVWWAFAGLVWLISRWPEPATEDDYPIDYPDPPNASNGE